MKTKALSREDRKDQILICFACRAIDHDTDEMTVSDIAKLMHLTASTKLRDMVLELVVDGVLDFRDEPIPGVAKFRRIYSAGHQTNSKTIHKAKPGKRSIPIHWQKQNLFLEMDDNGF